MNRVLRPTTIIPENLYVERAADRQLRQIVEDMGRPGYVLVARQMGKTNLLLSMKQKYEACGDIVLYIDLSNRFDSAHACLRNIIDIAIETNIDTLGHLEEKIYKDRSELQIEASTEFSRHIRLILKSNENKKVIIVLDEIDSLINSKYGDVILSQVRSTYFTRVNFPEYNRLTYVLSGVAEPTDLIKDKNISPFNIGEKIYLDDFSLEECQKLSNNAKLNINYDCIERVFYWTSGHPRMTWDILSSLEENSEKDCIVTPIVVDNVVEKLYLREFDRPPVDHMRVLLEGDAQLRNALISIRYGKGSAVDERIRGRLYLSGITNSLTATLSIKNQIIDQSLSDAWLSQAMKADTDPLTIATEHFVGRRHRLVIEALRTYELEGEKLPPNSRLQLGIALYNIDQFEEAATELRQVVDLLKGDVRTTALYYLGGALFLDGKYADSTFYLEDAALNGTGDLVVPARMLLAANYYWSPVSDAAERTLELRGEILASLKKEEASDPYSRGILTASVYNLAVAAAQAGEEAASTFYFSSAMKLATPNMLPTIMITAAELSSDDSRKVNFTTDAANIVIDHGLKYSLDGEATLAFRERTLAALIASLHSPYQADVLERVLDYATTLYSGGRSKWSILIKMASLLEEMQSSILFPVLETIESSYAQDLTHQDQITLFRMLATHNKVGKEERTREYFKLIIKIEDFIHISQEDILFIIASFNDMLSESKMKELIDIADLIIPKFMKSENSIWAAWVAHLKMQALTKEKKLSAARSVAAQVVSIADEARMQIKNLPELESFLDRIIANANSIIPKHTPALLDPFRKIGRNQKITVANTDGTFEREVKFKIVEHQLRAGTLKIVCK